MKFDQMPEDVQARVKQLRKKLCELPQGKREVLEDMCAACVSQCDHGRELLRILGVEPKFSRLGMMDVFEPVHHARERRTQKIIRGLNRGRRL